MARSFSQYVLAAAVVAVVSGNALAQDKTALQEAVTLLRLGKNDEAIAKLREVIAADPSNEQALKMYQSVSQDEWYLLMTTQGEDGQTSEIQKIAQSILERARREHKTRSRDEGTIAGLVTTATAAESDYPTRQAAVNKLINDHGEFAVPALLGKLGDQDNVEGQVQAIATLQQISSAAVLPLIEALKSTNTLAVRNAAAALYHIGDTRALPMMAHLANDERAEVATVAKRFLEKHKAAGNAADLVVAQGREYLKGNVPLGGFSEVVWNLRDEKLVPTDVLPLLYPAELAKGCGETGLVWAPSSLSARSLVAQANLAQANLIESAIAKGDESAKALAPVAAELKNTAMASGVDALRAALDAGVEQNLAPVAIGAIQALALTETVDSVGSSSLLHALRSNNKQVRYAAATALVRASGGVRVPQAEEVVAVLADAVTEESVRNIQVIAPAMDTKAVIEAASHTRGLQVGANESAISGMRGLHNNPNVDVVVINEVLPDGLPEDVIGNMKRDGRMSSAKVIIVAKDEAAAKTRFGDGVTVLQGPLTGENLVTAVNAALEGVATQANERAEGFAVGASESLKAMAENKIGINAALTNLSAQLNRGDAIAVPAAKALGYAGAGAELPALVGALGGSGSIDLKKASADATGAILARTGSCPDDVFMALATALEGATDVELRAKVASALGKANVSPEKRAELLQKLHRVAAAAPAAG